MKKKANFFRQTNLEEQYNLYLGGVGSIITSETILRQYFTSGISSDSEIENFTIDSNNNVACKITVDFGFKVYYSVTYDIQTYLTYFYHTGGVEFTNGNINSFQNATVMKWFYSGNKVTANAFQQRLFLSASALELIVLRDILLMGHSNTYNNQIFNGCTSLNDLFVDSTMQTAGGGSVEYDVAYAITNYSPNVYYCSDKSSIPDRVTDASTSNITSSSVDISFTTPSSTNTIWGYEVWNDIELLGYISASGATFSGLSSGTSYSLRLKTVDNQYNISQLGNTFNFTTS